jgi:hypothetical protein
MNYIILGNTPSKETHFLFLNEQKLSAYRYKFLLNNLFKKLLIKNMKFSYKKIRISNNEIWSTILYYNINDLNQQNIIKYIVDNLPEYWNSKFVLEF